MIQPFNSRFTLIALAIFTMGLIIGRLSAPAPGTASGATPIVEKAGGAPSPRKTRAQTRSTSHPPSDSSLPLPTQPPIKGESLFDAVPVDHFENLARSAAASPEDIQNESLLRVLLSEWAKKDPYAALAYAEELDRGDLSFECLKQLAKVNPDEALDWIEQHAKDDGQHRYLTMAVFQGMAHIDPAGAVARVEQMAAGARKDELLSITVNEWARQDVEAAFDWIETAELNPQFTYIYNQVMGHYIEQDPLAASALVSEMTASDNKLSFASQVACKLAEQDVDYALEWAQTLDGNEKKYALQGIMDRWASGPNANDALNYLLDNPEAPNYKNLLSTVAMSMSHNQPDQLAEALTLMPEQDQPIAAAHLAAVYSINDPAKCDEWLATLAPGTVRDAALERALNVYKYSNVPQAFQLTETLSNDALRTKQMRAVLINWIPVDQQAAEQALNNSTVFTPEEKERVLNQVYRQLKPNDYLLPPKPSS